MRPTELRLPHDLLQRASLRGNEYAWPIEDIPKVIEAARQANLASIGGQLQFRLPDGGTCECYWVEVDTYKSVPTSLPWQERVDQTATVALADFSRLLSKFDFVAEGRRSFAEHFKRLEAEGGDPTQMICFVWYLDDGKSSPDWAQS
ncbi:MAG TPA: hypothetical protein VGL35_14575 [Rhizomicrobium sp.]